MKTRILAAVLPVAASLFGAVFFSTTARGEIVRTVEKEFSTQQQTLAGVYVETASGNVNITRGDEGRVRVVARQVFAQAASEAEADAAAQTFEFDISQTNNDVVASAIASSRTSPVRVDFDITVPPTCIVDVRTSGRGNVTLDDLRGMVRVRAQSGAIRIGNITGVVDARTSSGAISLASATRLATLESESGAIECGPVGGNLEVDSHSGHIHLSEITGAVAARTNSGNVSARISGVAQRDCSISTARGSIALEAAATSSLLLDAYANAGRVYADTAALDIVAGGPGKPRCAGRINGDIVLADGRRGALVKMRTGGGDIDVKTSALEPPLPAGMVANNRVALAD